MKLSKQHCSRNSNYCLNALYIEVYFSYLRTHFARILPLASVEMVVGVKSTKAPFSAHAHLNKIIVLFGVNYRFLRSTITFTYVHTCMYIIGIYIHYTARFRICHSPPFVKSTLNSGKEL